jgi:hypothetical protein
MKQTDVILPINCKVQGDVLQMAVVNTTRFGTQVIKLSNEYPMFIVVAVEPDEWVKVSIDERQTIKMDPTLSTGLTNQFNYITYNITAEKTSSAVDPNCDYFITKSNQLDKNSKTKKQRVLKNANSTRQTSKIEDNKVI